MILCKNKVKQEQQPSLTVFIAKCGDTIERQLAWLFGISLNNVTEQGELQFDTQRKVDYFTSLILEKIGIKIEDKDSTLLRALLERFEKGFPSTNTFSEFARSIVPDVDYNDADNAIVSWMDSEERAFRLLENHIVKQKIVHNFASVDDFVNFSLSVHNRRKSRAGFALENHLKYLFTKLDIKYDYNKVTENRSKPDFIFPSIIAYRDQAFPEASLTMLGVKTTCKDRWRQVLSEAQRIKEKHLLTLEPGISQFQTDEMIDSNLKLVVPSQIFNSYTQKQQQWLMNINSFVDLVRNRNNG